MLVARYATLALCLNAGRAAAQPTPPNEWENPRMVEHQQEKAHASFLVAEFERDLLCERTHVGRASARVRGRGRVGGRQRGCSEECGAHGPHRRNPRP
ncbi:hypothetical protein [Hymenobacter terrenus]|uniref:hypothetical protein n=1 Tax=Hymenobacter terrenus TaxID=1629124 RepID=UPI000A98A176|nr:hypothetical protein [Hymenobacter terrenus]